MLSNTNSMDWYVPGVNIDSSHIAEYSINSEDRELFLKDGAIRLPGVFNDWVEPLRRGFQRNIDNPEEYAFPCESNPAGKPGSFFDSYCNWQRIPEYLDFLQSSCAASMAGQFTNSKFVRFFHEHAFQKSAGTQQATPWHQDIPYYCVDGQKTISVYVSLDYSPKNVAVQFLKGSHRWSRLFHPRAFLDGSNFDQQHAVVNSQTFTEPVPDDAIARGDYGILSWDLEPGDVILFDFRTLHGTTDAEVKSTRRAFSTRWLGDDVTYCERPVETSPPYRDHGMRDGDDLRDDWFPIVWRST
jgi:ectoine hydroxylase-related dioxygenase (phytanoyl-CoA dioxygenase family)